MIIVQYTYVDVTATVYTRRGLDTIILYPVEFPGCTETKGLGKLLIKVRLQKAFYNTVQYMLQTGRVGRFSVAFMFWGLSMAFKFHRKRNLMLT